MGQSRGYGFVQFESEESAKIAAIAKLNGKVLNDKQIFVGPFLRKEERESAADKVKFTNVYVKNLSEKELSRRYEQGTRETGNKFDGLNLYVKNLDDTVTDEKLRELFAEFGTITSCKVMRDPSGTSKGSGFVA